MKDEERTREQLIKENEELRLQLAELSKEATPDLGCWKKLLKESEQKYRALADSVNEGIMIVQNNRFIYVNRKMSDLLRTPIQKLIGSTVFDFVWPEDRHIVEASARGRFEGKSIADSYEFRIVGAGGEPRWVSLSVAVVPWNGGPATLNLVRDITRLKQIEEEIRLSELKFRALAEITSTAIFLIQDTKYIYVNPAFKAIVGYSMDDLAGMNFWDFVHPDYRELVKTRGLDRLKGEKPRSRYEFKVIAKNGEEKWVDFTATGIQLDGRPTIVGSTIDITEQKQAESQREVAQEALSKSESLLRAITESAQDAIVMMDPAGSIAFWNPAAEHMFGYPCGEAIGKDLHALLAPPRYLESYRAAFAEFRKSGRGGAIGGTIELHAQRNAGDEFPIELSLSSVRLEDGWHALAIIRDITGRKRAEQSLRESEEKYRTLSNNIPDVTYSLDRAGKIIAVSEKAVSRYGYDEEMLAGNPFLNIIHPDDRDMVVNSFLQAMEDHREYTRGFQFRVLAKDGTPFWVELNSHMRFDEQGLYLQEEGVLRDITVRKQTEEALRKSEEYFRTITQNASDVLFTVDERGTIIYVSPSAERIVGYKPEELIGENVFDLFIPEDLPRAIDAFGQALLTRDVDIHECFRIRHKDGTERIMEGVGKNLLHNPAIASFMVNVRDVTDQKRAEEKLRESEQRLSDIIEFLPDATLVVDKDGNVIAWNRAIEEMTGIGKENMLGRGDRLYSIPFYGDNRPILIDLALSPDPELEKQYTAIQRRGDMIFGEAYTTNLPPGDVHMSATASVLRDSHGEIIAAIECIRNNTERKRMEERLTRAEKMEALGTLAGGVAHDLNNVLGVLVGYSELLAEKLPEGSQMRRHADNILKSGVKGAAIIQDLLTLARRGVAVSEVVGLNRVVRDYLRTPEFEKLLLDHRGIVVRTELADDLLNIKGSPVHLGKTIMNLVSNAAEAISGKGIITIKTENCYLDQPIRGYDYVQEGDYVVLTILDTGQGISAQDIGKIFEPFYTNKVMGRSGTGLGLAVVWGTVKDHSGYIDVQSLEGAGTTFTLYFPVTREEPALSEKKESIAAYMGKGESILVVDDVKEQRELATSMLTRLGYRVEVVSTGEEAIPYINRKKADLIVLDMIMNAGIDGLETYRRVLEINPRQKAVVVSGFSETERVRKTLELGAGAFVRKPYVLEKIGLAVRRELDRP